MPTCMTLTAQQSRLRDIRGHVKRLLQLAAGEVLGDLEDTRDYFGAATAAAVTREGLLHLLRVGEVAA